MLLPINKLLPATPVFGTCGLSWLPPRRNRGFLLCLAVAWPFVGIAKVSAQALTPGILPGWGYNADGQSSVLADLSGATAIAAGLYHNVHLKAVDST